MPRPTRNESFGWIARSLLVSAGLIATSAFVVSRSSVASAVGSAPVAPAFNAAVQTPEPPADLQSLLEALGEAFHGRVGIAVHDLDEGWVGGFRAGLPAPQQSVSKLWVALATLDAVDRGSLRLDQMIHITRQDLTVFNQPIRTRLTADGYSASVAELLRLSLTQSDNTANDVLLRQVGGSAAVRSMLAAKRLEEISFGPGERALQSGIAGVEWRPEYSEGRAFWAAREALPMQARTQALQSYLAAPSDGATPDGIVRALARLGRGELLKPASTALMLDLLRNSKTGAFRLKAGTPVGWRLAHKTGTGQVLGHLATGYSDVGLLTSPEGKTYAVAVMIAQSSLPERERQRLIASVPRLVAAWHSRRWSQRPQPLAAANVP